MNLLAAHINAANRDLLGRVFTVAQQKGYDTAVFADRFMQSKIAASMDNPDSGYNGLSAHYLVAAIAEDEKVPKVEQQRLINEDVVEWVGWMYRYWQVERNTTSAEINKLTPFDRMVWFYPLHQINPRHAIDDIIGNSKGYIYDVGLKGWRPREPEEQKSQEGL